MRCAAMFVTGLALAACGTSRMYDGPERPPNEVARVLKSSDVPAPKNQMGVETMRVSIGFLDQKGLSADTSFPYSDAVEILPGEHVATCVVSVSGFFVTSNARFTAAAGKTYRPSARAAALLSRENSVLGITNSYPTHLVGLTTSIEEVAGGAAGNP